MNQTVKLICGCCFLFLLVQWLLHHYASRETTKAGDNRTQLSAEATLGQTATVYVNIANFTSTCLKYGIPVILVDPRVLEQIIHGSTLPKRLKCRFLCNENSLTYLTVEHQLWSHQDELLQDLTHMGFSNFLYRQNSPISPQLRIKPSNSQILTHLEAQRHGHSILVSFLYETGHSGHGDLWSAMLQGPGENIGVLRKKGRALSEATLIIGQHPSLWKRFKISKVNIDGVPLRAPSYPEDFINDLQRSKFLECNQDAASQFHSRYPRDNSEEAEIFRQNARSLLRRAKAVLDELGIPFWLSSGTCLGWFRQCDFIPYSKDVDIGIFIKHYNDSIIPAMQANGLFLKLRFGKVSDSLELSFTENDVKLDVFFFYEEADHVWNGGTQIRTGNKYKYVFKKFELCRTEFEGMIFHVPCDTKTYIRANYGDGWKEPAKQWDWKKSPPNVQENGQWPKEEWPEVIQSF